MTAPVCLPVDVRPVPGWPKIYVSADGEVYGPRGRRKVHPDVHGYLYTSIRQPGRTWPGHLRVHIAVLLAWVGPCPAGMEARHINGQQQDNAVANLEWATHAVNLADQELHGTRVRGEACRSARLTEENVREIKELRPGMTLVQLARRYDVGKTTVRDVVNGRTWRHVR